MLMTLMPPILNKFLKILEGHFETESPQKKSGTLEIDKNTFKIYTEDGTYFPLEVQLEGKKRMKIKDFLNGFREFDHISISGK